VTFGNLSAADELGKLGRLTEIKQRLLFLIGALIVYRIGTFIPVPGIDAVKLAQLFSSQQGTILDMFNMFSGGALQRFSVLALGIMPYISASIIVQLLTAVSPASNIPVTGRLLWRLFKQLGFPLL